MNRIVSALLLLVLALPYARTPICSTSGHEHEGHDRSVAALAAHDGGASDTSDCHSLMACDTTIQGVMTVTAVMVEIGLDLAVRTGPRVPEHTGPVRAPIPPPPQAV